MTTSPTQPASTWQDPDADPASRLDALIAEMSLPEKLAQLGSIWLRFDVVTGEVAPMQNVFSRDIRWPEAAANGIGHLTRMFGTRPVTAAEGVQRVRELQRTVVESSRLGIPAIVHEECLTGFTTYQATVYPTALAWAATFDPDLVHEMAVLVAVSGRPYALGQYQGRAAALVEAFFPGEEGGGTLAGVLSGRVNPSGKLPVEVPRHAGGQPHTYLAPPLGQDTSLRQNSQGLSNLDPTPAFPFGHGLS